MKRIAVVFLVMMLAFTACSMPKLVKVEDTPDPTATAVVIAPEPTEVIPEPTEVIPEPTDVAPEPTEVVTVPTKEQAQPSATEEVNLYETYELLMMECFSAHDGTRHIG